jgi:hypothetical protein
VYVQPFGRAGEKQQVSVGGGAQPRWRPDGREIFYIALDGRLTAVSVKAGQGDGSPELGRPELLFVVDAVTTSPIEVILNFDPASHR